MSHIVYLCFRNPAQPAYSVQDIDILSERLSADNILSAKPPLILEKPGLLCGIINPNSTILIDHLSVCFGNWTMLSPNWHEPRAPLPETFHALFRGDNDYLELATDVVASRTIWYVKTESMFVASTSQRALVYFLQDFEPEPAAPLWMLSSGCLGPGYAWDRRISALAGGSRLILDRHEWTIDLTTEAVEFEPVERTPEEHQSLMTNLLEETFGRCNFVGDGWALTLSGGYDSRYILHQLRNQKQIKCITWGMRSAINDKKTDVYIAKEVAERYGMSHAFFAMDSAPVETTTLLQRFVRLGEGRSDLLSGYRDGFALWKNLYDDGIECTIRGDVGFGNRFVESQADVVKRIGITMLSNYFDDALLDEFGLQGQTIPPHLQRRPEETLATWRDRLYYGFRVPYGLAPLNYLKSSYVEIVNPLLTNSFAQFIQTVPDELRTDKLLFRRIIRSLDPDAQFAKYAAIENRWDMFKTPEVTQFLTAELQSSDVKNIFPTGFVAFVLANTSVKTADGSMLQMRARQYVRRIKGRWLRSGLDDDKKFEIDFNRLAFRMYIVAEMYRLLRDDAHASGWRAQQTDSMQVTADPLRVPA